MDERLAARPTRSRPSSRFDPGDVFGEGMIDGQTLQPRHRFGLSRLDCVRGMAVVGEELFVCDQNNDRLQVFSLAGEHRREITGEWKRPAGLYPILTQHTP